MAAPKTKSKNPVKRVPKQLPEKLLRLTETLEARAKELTSPADADRALIMQVLALHSETLAKLARDARNQKPKADPKNASAKGTPAKTPPAKT